MLLHEYRITEGTKNRGEALFHILICDLNVHRIFPNGAIRYIDYPESTTVADIIANHDAIFDSVGKIIFTSEIEEQLKDGTYYICDTRYDWPRKFLIENGKILQELQYRETVVNYSEELGPYCTYYTSEYTGIDTSEISIKEFLQISNLKFDRDYVIEPLNESLSLEDFQYYPDVDLHSVSSLNEFIQYDNIQLYHKSVKGENELSVGWNIISDNEDYPEPCKIFVIGDRILTKSDFEEVEKYFNHEF